MTEVEHFATHEDLKDSPEWDSLPLVGVLPGSDGDPDLELRNCRTCMSTLGRERRAERP